MCPKVEGLKLYRDIPICDLLALSCHKLQTSRFFATKNANLFYQWLTKESSFGKINSIAPTSEYVSKFDSLQLHNDRKPLNVTFAKQEKNDTRGPTLLRKQQVTCTDSETETLKKYFSLLEHFKFNHVYSRECAKTETKPLIYAQ